MQRLFIIRHGQSADNAQKTIGGKRDVPLTELGKRQALLAGQDAKRYNIDLIVCSPLERSRMTAEIIAESIGYSPANIKIMYDLVERSFGVLEGLPEGSGGSHEEVNGTVGVESLEHLQERSYQVLRELAADKAHKRILVVCHFWMGRMLKVTAGGQAAQAIYDQPPLANATIEELA